MESGAKQTIYKVFSFGSNNPLQVARRLECPYLRYYACEVQDMKLAFAGKASRWEGKSPATLIPREGAVVKGVCYELTEAQVLKLDEFEGHPIIYARTPVVMRLKGTSEAIEGVAYIMQDLNEFIYPAKIYLEAISKTHHAYHLLPPWGPGDDETSEISIEIVNALTGDSEGTEIIPVSAKDLVNA